LNSFLDLSEEHLMRSRNAMAFPRGCTFWLVLSTLVLPALAQEAAKPKKANRLAKETSPYLLLHAHNPVDWYPWGPEAFEKAKKEGKPIFLSVGYSSCYWCHVMERESFMDEGIAKTLNERFVSIKVDREERPDVDQIYMAALQALSGGGGWPMSMFLTPDGRPFFGGTYFPPRDRQEGTGFSTLLERVYVAWRDHRPELERDADTLTKAARRALAGSPLNRKVPISKEILTECRAALAERYDPDFGGFGYDPDRPKRPKFPEPVNMVFLLDQHRRQPGRVAGDARYKGPLPLFMVFSTLDHLARGGIRDQIAGGYHRYSTERNWNIPHFEKMLYDNAQLASLLVSAYEATSDDRWEREADDTFAFVARSLTAPDGSFYSALDAETDGEEGAYYLWTRAQAKKVLGADYDDFARVYGLDREPNFENGRHVLFQPTELEVAAKALDIAPTELLKRLKPLRAKMLAAREKRPAPLRDEKILTAWNGLMIAACSDGFRVFKNDAYRVAAERAADFLWTHHRKPDGRFLRTSRAGTPAKLDAYLEDYAFLAFGLLRLHDATGDAKRLEQAKTLVDRMITDFEDTKEGGFFYTAEGHESLFARPKDPYDNALPSGNSVAIRALLAIAKATGELRYRQIAGKALDAFSPVLAQSPLAAPLMLVGVGEYLDGEAGANLAQPSSAAGTSAKSNIVSARGAVAGDAKVEPRAEVDVKLTVTIADGWHLYANPIDTENLKPTTVVLGREAPATLLRVDYPKGERKRLAGSTGELAVYESEIVITARVRLSAEAKGPSMSLPFVIRYQACNDRACLAPATLEIPVQLGGN
jgi:uncharacterized protein YyaL (SSP411 family)